MCEFGVVDEAAFEFGDAVGQVPRTVAAVERVMPAWLRDDLRSAPRESRSLICCAK